MSRIQRRRPSPAILIAVLALIAAVAGTAVAGPDASTSLSKKATKKTAKKVANKQIKKKAPGLHVNSATNATNATNADTLDGVDSTGLLGSPIRVRETTKPVIGGHRGTDRVSCNAGETLTGGGVRFATLPGTSVSGTEVVYSGPAGPTLSDLPAPGSTPTAWQASAFNGLGVESTMHVWALCAST